MAVAKQLEHLLQEMLRRHGSELWIIPGRRPACNIAGIFIDLQEEAYSNQALWHMLESFLGPEHIKLLDTKGFLQFNGAVENARFRITLKKVAGKVTFHARPSESKSTQTKAPPPEEPGPIPGRVSDEKTFEYLLMNMEAYQASDLHLRDGCKPCYRVHGTIRELDLPPYSSEYIRRILYQILSPDQIRHFESSLDLDCAHSTPDGGRFRINAFLQKGTVAVVARRVATKVPTFKELHLPPVLNQIAQLRQGLVLVCGITGSGKSTTLAAVIEVINQTRHCNILTLEDPIEYLYKNKMALIAQREIGIDVLSFEAGLKHVLRQDPDVILIGELRDAETFHTALQASETGHLVFGTLHSSTVAQTIGRIIELFPPQQHQMVRHSLAFNLRAVLCQTLLPALHQGAVPAVEVLLCNSTAQKLIRENRDHDLESLIISDDDMQDFNQSIHQLIQDGLISVKVGMEYSPKPEKLKMLLKGILLSEDKKIIG